MAILSVCVHSQGHSHTFNSTYERVYTQVLRVVTDDPSDGPITVRAAIDPQTNLSVPQLGTYYQFAVESTDVDVYSICRGITVNPVDQNGMIWEVTCEFGRWDPNRVEPNELLRQPEIAWSFQQHQEIVDVDIYGNLVANTAGDLYDPGISRDVSWPVLTIRRNEAEFSPSLSYLYSDAINLLPWWGAPPRVVRVVSIGSARAYSQTLGQHYWVTDYQFAFKPSTWVTRVQSSGWRQRKLTAAGNIDPDKKETITFGAVPTTKPQLLGENGRLLPTNATEAFIQEFHIYNEVDFSVFALDGFYNYLTS